MNFFDVLREMLVILFGIAMGYGARRLGYLDGKTSEHLTGLLVNLTLPAMILAAVMTSDSLPDIPQILAVLEVSVVFYALAFAAALTVPRLLGGTPGQQGVWKFALAFSNVGFIGYPVAVALFGPDALFYAVILALPFNVLSYALGPLMLVGRSSFRWRQAFSPCVVASVVSLLLALTRVQGPPLLGQMFQFVGDVTVPLALMVVGAMLAGLPAREVLASPRIWALTALRLLVLPTALCLILRAMHIETLVLDIAVIQMAMPVAVNGTLLCITYGGDGDSMARVTFLSTAASILTIPLLAAWLL